MSYRFPAWLSVAYLITNGAPGEFDYSVIPIPRSRVVSDCTFREVMEKLWSASDFIKNPAADEKMAARCSIDLPAAARTFHRHAFMIVIPGFLDPYTLNVKQLMK